MIERKTPVKPVVIDNATTGRAILAVSKLNGKVVRHVAVAIGADISRTRLESRVLATGAMLRAQLVAACVMLRKLEHLDEAALQRELHLASLCSNDLRMQQIVREGITSNETDED